ncbi:alpha/beta fold hydrolase [Paraburkholderia tropica]|uniref:alpha/beta fold hydrolase n=1 Tax=Paraburkholderia tropica TaxID=92647 RepID=UPI002AB2A08A|nr:alpha/beta fold hydrolase [Paraburkholderia tropica]
MAESKFVEGSFEGAPWSIHYTVEGSGPAVILLHGGGPGATGSSNYSRNIKPLAQSFTVYALDMPGWGKSSKNLQIFGTPNPFMNGARALKAFMDALDIEKANLIGNSYGGAVAYYMAMQFPDAVDRFVAMGPGGAYIDGQGPTEGIMQLLTYYAGEGPSREKLSAFLQNLVFDTSVLTTALIEQRFEASNDPEITANPPLTLSAGGPPPRQFYLSEDPRLKALTHRCLLIWGQQDKVNLPAGALSFAGVPNQDVVLFANCGHWAQWEQADKFNHLVTWFLKQA